MGGGRERFPLVVHIPSRRAVLNVQRFLSLELEFAFGGGGGKRKKERKANRCAPPICGKVTKQSKAQEMLPSFCPAAALFLLNVFHPTCSGCSDTGQCCL